MVRECGEEDAEDDWQRALEARRQHQGQNLSFVTDLGEADEHGRDKERFHGDAIGVGRDVNLGTDPSAQPGCRRTDAKGLAKPFGPPAPWPKPSVLTQTPQITRAATPQ